METNPQPAVSEAETSFETWWATQENEDLIRRSKERGTIEAVRLWDKAAKIVAKNAWLSRAQQDAATIKGLREALEKIANQQPMRHIDEERSDRYVDCVVCETMMATAAAALAPPEGKAT